METLTVTADNLNSAMEFDHVITVHADGTVTDDSGLYAPETYFYLDAEGDAEEWAEAEMIRMVESYGGDGWKLMRGYTGQYGYAGPLMHVSEYIGGRMAEDILSTPGHYVALAVECIGSDPDEEHEPAGWAIAYIAAA